VRRRVTWSHTSATSGEGCFTAVQYLFRQQLPGHGCVISRCFGVKVSSCQAPARALAVTLWHAVLLGWQ
jgi:hypothetical protein